VLQGPRRPTKRPSDSPCRRPMPLETNHAHTTGRGHSGQSSAGPGILDVTHLTIECDMKASMPVNRSGGMSVEP
jgi:hypothetical protein